MIVVWENFIGEKFEGELVEIDNGTAVIRMEDGTLKSTDAECLIPESEKHLYKGWD